MTAEESEERTIAVKAYNRCWDLLDAPERTPDDNDELLTAAFAQRYHWRNVGGGQQSIVADWMVGRVAADIGYPDLALHFAQRAFEQVQSGDHPAWLRASLCEGLARAYASAGDADARNEWLDLARRELERETDAEDAALIASQIDSVPEAK